MEINDNDFSSCSRDIRELIKIPSAIPEVQKNINNILIVVIIVLLLVVIFK